MKNAGESRVSSALIPALIFLGWMLHGSLIGLTDDEAYHWVLAQRPNWAFAYHPPMMGWFVAASQAFWSLFSDSFSVSWIVRFPSALSMALLFELLRRWIASIRVSEVGQRRVLLTVMCVPGLFALSWMMVPDTSLFLGWMFLFTATWRLCFEPQESRISVRTWGALFLGVALLILSKYSGILAVGSAGLCVLLLAPQKRRPAVLLTLVLASALAFIPLLIWNSQHEWESILYQVRDRHQGGQWSMSRYFRFWLTQIVAVGIPLLIFLPKLASEAIRRATPDRFMDVPQGSWTQVVRFCALWAFPPACLYFIQPLWSDFKPHWTLVVWWPAAIAFGFFLLQSPKTALSRFHHGYGIVLGAFLILSCHVPLVSVLTHLVKPGAPAVWDVTNDLYGWSELPRVLNEKLSSDENKLPILGSRYQTASQTAAAFKDADRVSLIPREIKARDEWAVLDVVDSMGPGWPKLLKPILYVADNRYQEEPHYIDSKCTLRVTHETRRWSYEAKTIKVWRCDPSASE